MPARLTRIDDHEAVAVSGLVHRDGSSERRRILSAAVQHAHHGGRHTGIQARRDMDQRVAGGVFAAARGGAGGRPMPARVDEGVASARHGGEMTTTRLTRVGDARLQQRRERRRRQANTGVCDRGLVLGVELAPVDSSHVLNISSSDLYFNQRGRRLGTKLR